MKKRDLNYLEDCPIAVLGGGGSWQDGRSRL